MQWFNQLKVGVKLAVSFIAVLVLTMCLGVFSTVQMAQVNQSSVDLAENTLPSIRAAGIMNAALSDYRIAETQHIISPDDAEMARQEQTMADIGAAQDKEIAAYGAVISSPEERAIFDSFAQSWKEYRAESRKVVELSRAGKDDEAQELTRGASRKEYDEAKAALAKLTDLNSEEGKKASGEAAQRYEDARMLIIAMIGIAVVFSAAIAVVLTRGLLRQLGGEPLYAAEVANRIAAGDLTMEVAVAAGDNTSLLAAMRAMRNSLAEIVNQVRLGTDNISAASTQIASGNLDLSSRTEQQASSLEETASSMEELTTAVKNNAESARQANELAASASAVASQGGTVVGKVVDTMDAINASANKIVDIISVIDGIAFQTNILALNAAVEAARAGEQGRGFAVVASEVRSLAQRSATAAKEIKALIGDSVEKVGAGAKLVNEAGETMQRVLDSIERVTGIMNEIAASSHEQTAGIEQVNQAIGQMDAVTQQNASLVEEAAAASESLKEQAAELSRAVGVFKVAAAFHATGTAARLDAPAAKPAVRLAGTRRSAPSGVPATVASPVRQTRKQTTSEGDWAEF